MQAIQGHKKESGFQCLSALGSHWKVVQRGMTCCYDFKDLTAVVSKLDWREVIKQVERPGKR